MIYEDFFTDEVAKNFNKKLKPYRNNGLKIAFMSDIR